MSTNKREESEGLVPAQRKSAMNHWHTMKPDDRDNLKNIYNRSQVGTYGSFDEFVDYVWIQEVVLPWQKAKHSTLVIKRSDGTATPATNEEIAECYLKEHSMKEESGTKLK